MLPFATNRYGDLMKEFYEGIKNNNLSEVRLDEIQRAFNELWTRENIYKSWVDNIGNIDPAKINLPFESIYSNQLEKDHNSLTIYVPSKYKHLLLTGSGRTNGVGTSVDNILVRYNSDAGANYINQKFFAINTTLTGERNTGQTTGIVGLLTQGGRPAGEVSTFFTFMPNYISDTLAKNSLSISVANYGALFLFSSNWNSVNVIDSITLFPGADDIAAGAVVSLYGIN